MPTKNPALIIFPPISSVAVILSQAAGSAYGFGYKWHNPQSANYAEINRGFARAVYGGLQSLQQVQGYSSEPSLCHMRDLEVTTGAYTVFS